MAEGGLMRAVFALLAGGAVAQLLPLMLGPWLTRLYSPQEFGHYHLFGAVAANLGVVACARYEFALPKAQSEGEARALRTLCTRIVWAVSLACCLAGATWAWWLRQVWPLWLPVAVGLLGLVSLATLEATRSQRVTALAWARVVQHGGGSVLQGVAGVMQAGLQGLIVGPLLAGAAALMTLGGVGPRGASRAECAQVARVHRDFPRLNTPHAFLGALQDSLSVALVAAALGAAGAGAWGLALRYLKAPATLVGGAVSQVLYPRLAQAGCTQAGRRMVLHTMAALALLALPGVLLLWWGAPALFAWAFGPQWHDAGELARGLALYLGFHFVASPLGVVSLAWDAQAWALKLALWGQAAFVLSLAAGLAFGGLRGAGWAISVAMALYFSYYFFRLATWPVRAA